MVVLDEASAEGYNTPRGQSHSENFVRAKALDGHNPWDLKENIEYEEESVDVPKFVSFEANVRAKSKNYSVSKLRCLLKRCTSLVFRVTYIGTIQIIQDEKNKCLR
jgi:hypothetical protein